MLAYALFMLLTRKLVDLRSAARHAVLFACSSAPRSAPRSRWHIGFGRRTSWQWLTLLSLGAFGGLGHYLLILAYRLAPASSVSPFLYFQILSMVGFGYRHFR